jgi:HD-like signal output (HDOD) protein
LACAFLAELYAPEIPMDVGAAYTAGVMHDIGRVVLAVAQPDEYAKLLQSGVESQAEALKREKEIFGIDHCELGRRMAIDWKLPSLFMEVTSRHHAAPDDVVQSEALAVVHFACKVADAIGFGAAPSFQCSDQELMNDLPKQRPDLVPAKLEELTLWIGKKINSIE